MPLYHIEFKCLCGFGVMERIVSEGDNRGRRYFGCMKGFGRGCDFFQWKYEKKNEKLNAELKCYCNHETVERTTKDGKNKGKQFFTCYKGKEKGCGFFLWKEVFLYNKENQTSIKCYCNEKTLEITSNNEKSQGRKYLCCFKGIERGCKFFLWKDQLPLYHPEVPCKCGKGSIERKSNLSGTYGKLYYGCLRGRKYGCNFFKWKNDQNKSDTGTPNDENIEKKFKKNCNISDN